MTFRRFHRERTIVVTLTPSEALDVRLACSIATDRYRTAADKDRERGIEGNIADSIAEDYNALHHRFTEAMDLEEKALRYAAGEDKDEA